MLADDLRTLEYLVGESSAQHDVARALQRFEHHAQRRYRRTVTGERLEETPVYSNPAAAYSSPDAGLVHPELLAEVARWLQLGFRLPLGYFNFAKVLTWGKLREDVAAEWIALAERIRQLGGTIDGPYGDTRRQIARGVGIGASKFSFHISGRAVDLNQGQIRYRVAREPRGSQTLWRIYCWTTDQSGAQGKKFEPGSIACYGFAARGEYPRPGGYYLDLTAEIERSGLFERIPAQNGWQQETRRSEWWHFQWVRDKQKTFQDECELVGITEAQLRAAGYADVDLDHPPG